MVNLLVRTSTLYLVEGSQKTFCLVWSFHQIQLRCSAKPDWPLTCSWLITMFTLWCGLYILLHISVLYWCNSLLCPSLFQPYCHLLSSYAPLLSCLTVSTVSFLVCYNSAASWAAASMLVPTSSLGVTSTCSITQYRTVFMFLSCSNIKATISVDKLIPQNGQMTNLCILIDHCTSLSPWFIILDKNNFVNVSHRCLTSGGYQVCLWPMPCGLICIY